MSDDDYNIPFDEITLEPSRASFTEGKHTVRINYADYYKNKNDNWIVRLRCKDDNADSDLEGAFYTVADSDGAFNMQNVAEIAHIFDSCGVDADGINQKNVSKLEGKRFVAECSFNAGEGSSRFLEFDKIEKITNNAPEMDLDDDEDEDEAEELV